MMFRTVCWPACGWFQKCMCLSNGSALRIGTSTLETTSNLHFQGDPLLKRKSDIPAPWHPSRPWCLGHPAKPPSQEKHWNKSKWSLRYGQSLNPFISPKRISRICYFHLSRFPTQKKMWKTPRLTTLTRLPFKHVFPYMHVLRDMEMQLQVPHVPPPEGALHPSHRVPQLAPNEAWRFPLSPEARW